MLLQVIVPLILVGLTAGQDYTEWIKKVDVEDTQTITFNCSEFPAHPKQEDYVNNTIVSWMLPNLDIVDLSFDDGRRQVQMGGWQLQINQVTKDDIGVYHCMMKTPTDDWYLIKWGLNMRGPFFVSLWSKYWLNTVIGISAMAGFLMICAAVYIIYKYQWVPPPGWGDEGEEELAKKTRPLSANGIGTYTNAAYTDDGMEMKPTESAVMSGYEKAGLPEDEPVSPPEYVDIVEASESPELRKRSPVSSRPASSGASSTGPVEVEPQGAVITSEATVHATPSVTQATSNVTYVDEAPDVDQTRF